jgi:hypothetical protein
MSTGFDAETAVAGVIGMSNTHLSVYLNDHLAGGTAALELLRHLERSHPNTPIAEAATALHGEVTEDHHELERLMRSDGVTPGIGRRMAALLGEKVAELKARVDDPTSGALRLLETLEALSLGIEGKHALWIGLASIAGDVPAFRTVDFGRLKQRAQDQRNRVEQLRLGALRAAIADSAGRNP